MRCIKFSGSYGYKTDHPIPARRSDLVFISKKKNLSSRGSCHSNGPHNENERKQKHIQIHGLCQRAWFGCVLWHIDPCGLFKAKSCLYI